jgi:Type I phosphodiesterase / nucleotide pyrophosphatase
VTASTSSSSAAPSIASFRRQVQAILASRSGPQRHVIVLGVDGIPYELARQVWRRAHLSRARSVFPTTSATAWLTSLTGEAVDSHGIPGVVFAVPDDGPLIDVYTYQGPLGDAPPEDLFSDAARAGYTPVAILGDLEDTRCTWRDLLVHRAHRVHGHPFFARLDGALDPQALADRLAAAVEHALSSHPGPCLVWCFVDADRHIHRRGYDPAMLTFLEIIDELAAEWARDATVIAHSDHGLVATRHDPLVADVLERVIAAERCRMGGAGRTRWLYVEPSAERRVRDELLSRLPASIRIHHADELFAPGSPARRRVGSIVLVAHGEDFLAADGVRFEHGSMTEAEFDVPVAEWRAC